MITVNCETLGDGLWFVKVERVTGMQRVTLYELRVGLESAHDVASAIIFAIGNMRATGGGALLDKPEPR